MLVTNMGQVIRIRVHGSEGDLFGRQPQDARRALV